jgi:2,3-bisphosphoglycerate-dependent phosphoglycerate mutase
VERLILIRHAESEYSVRGLMSGDPRIAVGLTDAGREQARLLGEALASEQIDLCVTTEFARTIETADVAFAGRQIPRLVVPELNEHTAGRYEGRPFAEYLAWAHTAGPLDVIPGTEETRALIAARLARGFALLLDRPERTIVAVLHSLPITYLAGAAAGSDPAQRLPLLAYAEPQELNRRQVEAGVARLELWSASPSWVKLPGESPNE